VAGSAGDGGPATAARLNSPTAVVATLDGGFLIADRGNHRVRRVSPTGIISTAAGGGALPSITPARPRLRVRWDARARLWVVVSVLVRDVPAGSYVATRCRGPACRSSSSASVSAATSPR
jgi:NHL repeat-containing protein